MNEAPKPSIGAEMPYRRSQLNKRTGSLIFDRHLEESRNDAAMSDRGGQPESRLGQQRLG